MSLANRPNLTPTETHAEREVEKTADVDPLLGQRILIVEDDPYILLALEEMLAEYGLIVAGVARTLAAALSLARHDNIDIALLDVNLGHDKIDPVADALAGRGRPFVFTTGCGRAGLPERYADHVLVEKPFYIEEILKTLRAELARTEIARENR
jgi:DNA-binding response OmpR family regulator